MYISTPLNKWSILYCTTCTYVYIHPSEQMKRTAVLLYTHVCIHPLNQWGVAFCGWGTFKRGVTSVHMHVRVHYCAHTVKTTCTHRGCTYCIQHTCRVFLLKNAQFQFTTYRDAGCLPIPPLQPSGSTATNLFSTLQKQLLNTSQKNYFGVLSLS